ncbi:MAG: GyrI-like domain-containing protein [Caldisericia bacterium]|nr:GyrI-like domain-containing protein [Caldisericia bacterium]MDD4614666.1 GyrI-like domain-containing protein [Caldisericia bacterium]
MNPKIVTKDSIYVVGVEYVGENKNDEIKEMWGQFNAIMKTIPNQQVPMKACYGVCYMLPEDTNPGTFRYIAGVETKILDDIPQGMKGITIPAGKYAVFTHKGKLDTLHQTYADIYQKWIPEMKLVPRSLPDIPFQNLDYEYYDERFMVDDDNSEFDICIAIKD